MTPRERARELYRTGGPDTFWQDVATHYETGHVIDNPEFFMVWRTVGEDWPLEKMLDPRQNDPSGRCAFIWMASGDWRKAVVMAMGITPWVQFAAYQRRGVPRFIAVERILDNSG